MKNKFLIFIFLIALFYIKNSFAIEVETSIDMSAVFSFCGGKVCNVPEGVGGFEIVFAGIIKYITFIASLGGVLFIVINGILYSMGGADDSLKTESKKRIMKTLIGIILLLMSGVILHIIAPWVYA